MDAFIDYQKSRSLLYTAAFSFGKQGQREIATRMAKAQADQAASFAADRSIQFHGGFGFTYDCDAQLYRRRAIFHASQYGDARYHKKKLADLLLWVLGAKFCNKMYRGMSRLYRFPNNLGTTYLQLTAQYQQG